VSAETAIYRTLHYIKFNEKNTETLQTLYKHYNIILETMETTPRISKILVWF